MLRILAEYLVPLALPTAVYFAVQWWLARRAATGHPVEKPKWWDAPWPWLIAAGIVLMLITLVVLAVTSGAPPDATYHPSDLENGRVRPGGFDR